MRASHFTPMILLIVLAGVLLSACGAPAIKSPIAMSSKAMSRMAMPDFVLNASATVQEAYQFAVSNSRALETIPCYCGCSRMGHKSNLDCYIKAISANGDITFDNHAAFCEVCVNITRDVKRLMQEGKSAREIRAYIDAQYSGFGPATDTRMPE